MTHAKMTAVRNYTNTHINPSASRLETESVFIPETVPAYAATEVLRIYAETKVITIFLQRGNSQPTQFPG